METTERSGRFAEYVDKLVAVIGHADRQAPMKAYCTGLLLPGERKSVEPMAALTDPARVDAQRQSLLHFVGKAPWDDAAVMRAVRESVLPEIRRHGPVSAWVVDDTGMPKKGKHSVGVKNQYCGVLGKNANCQVAVSVSLANQEASVPAAYRLYLPEEWCLDPERRSKCGVPDDVGFETKWQIALRLVRGLLAEEPGIERAPVVADAGYGDATEFRDGLTGMELQYAVGVAKNTAVWRPGEGPLAPDRTKGLGRPQTRVRRTREHRPTTALELARSLPAEAWQTATWREGSRGEMTSRFTALRIRTSHRDYLRREARPVEWLLMEWPGNEAEPTKYWLSTLPEATPLPDLVTQCKLRWRVERDYQELKDEIGLDHYEGRGWRGFHHHATLCIAAYGFLVAEHARLSPPDHRAAPRLPQPALPAGYRPRGSPAPR
jgi:SRSO17 transposase